ncbi:potassium channel family protein [Alkalihalobacillus sp. BA299]|uniref:potassium channel family protein n=1 Tax=Alkalihalobacillus sp. BA299 TaxID=2815938 RepID=UPI001ADA1265|nr:potassium channel family protein [Alkalihalobacillus sp. BA299]
MIFSLIKKVIDKTINIEHWKLILGGVLFIIISSFIVYLLEPKEFKSPFNGFWYVMTTISQVGFGDYIPKTIIGKLYSIFLYFVGIGFFAIMIAKWIDLLNNYEELKEKEILGYTGTNHIVMINWSQKTKITIEEVLSENQKVDIVLIDQANTSPINHKNIHYVQGDATKLDILQKANALFAASICIFAPDQVLDKAAEDGKILLVASTIKHLAKKANVDVYTIVEILDEDHISNTNQYYIDEFILSNKPFSTLMASKALHNYT